jgi:hypothetical protein
MTSLPNFSWSLVADSLWGTTNGLLEDNAQLRVRLAAVEKSQAAKLDQYQAEVRSEFDAIKRSIGKKVDVESHSARLSMLKLEIERVRGNFETLKCDPQRELEQPTHRLVAKSEWNSVKTSLTTKTELESHSAEMKREIMAVTGTTRSDLEKLRRELEGLKRECARKPELTDTQSQIKSIAADVATLRRDSGSHASELAVVKRATSDISRV